jgi:pimeloyl-ACP methyl ester carboxylesterase
MKKLLLLHGALGSKDNFIELTKALSSDYDVYSLNFNGHGNQQIIEDEFSISNFANEVLRFLDQKNIDSTAIFGYSMGGYVALYLAQNFPNRVQSVFTLATKFAWTIESATKESKLLNSLIIKEKVPKYATTLEQLHGNSWEKLMNATATLMLGLGVDPALKENDFRNIAKPILLAVGDKDVMVCLEETIAVYRLIPNAQLLVLPNTTHPIDRIDIVVLSFQIKRFFT